MFSSKKIILGLAVIALFFVLSSNIASAVDWWPLVPCGLNSQPAGATLKDANGQLHVYTRPCTKCDLFLLAHNIMNFITLGLIPPVAVLFFIWAGALILMGAATPKFVAQGKTIFTSTMTGIIIVLLAWLVTNTILKSLVASQYTGSWWQFQCTATIPNSSLNTNVTQPALSQEQNSNLSANLAQAATDTSPQDSYLYRMHLYYDTGQLYADRDFQFKYDVVNQKYQPENLTTQFPYRAEVVNMKDEAEMSVLFDPKQGDPSLRAGKITIDVPFEADGKEVNFYNNQDQLLLTIFVDQSSYCNDDNICDSNTGENTVTCPNDCKVPTPSPSAGSASGGISRFIGPMIYLVLGALIIGGWIFWKKRSQAIPPTIV